jgi:WD40 repeat protein
MAKTTDNSAAGQLLNLPWEAGWVTAVAILGSGKRVVAGNQTGQILMWDLPEESGAAAPPPTRIFAGHMNFITRLAITPDDRWLISTSYDHTVRLWDLSEQPAAKQDISLTVEEGTGKKSGKEKPQIKLTLPAQQAAKVLTFHEEWIRGLSLSGDGKLALTGDDRGTLILWNVADGSEIRRMQSKGWLQSVAMSPDGKLGVTCEFAPRYATFPNANLVWDLESGKMKFDLAKELPSKGGGESKTTGMAAAAVSLDGKLLAVGRGGEVESDTGKITLLDAATGKKVRELAGGHQYGVTGLCFHPDRKTLVSCGRDTVIRLWNIADGKQMKELGKPRGGQFKDWTHAISISADGKRLAAADMAGAVMVWGLEGK